MPGRGTPMRSFRLPDDLWDRFGDLAEQMGTDRGTLLREFVRWFVGERGAKLPKRPDR